jgi:transposase
VGDVRRFETPRQLMGYLGLVPGERSSGKTVRRGGITKAGNGRHMLVASAWTYRHPPRIGTKKLYRIEHTQLPAAQNSEQALICRLNWRACHAAARVALPRSATMAVGGATHALSERLGQQFIVEQAPPKVREIAWKAQTRLSARYRRLAARGKRTTIVCTAIARELAGFMWAVANEAQLAPL